MANRNQGSNSIISFLALVFLTYFLFLPVVLLILMKYFGSPGEILLSIADKIPFGEQTKEIVEVIWAFVVSFGSQAFTLTSIRDISISYVLQEMLKELAVLMVFEPLKIVLCSFLGLVHASGHWNKTKKALVISVCALIATVFAPIPINMFQEQIQYLSNNASNWLLATETVLMTAGGMAVFALIGGWILIGVVFGLLVLGAFQVTVGYFFLMFMLKMLEEKVYWAGAISVAGLVVTSVFVALASILMESFKAD